MALFPQFPYANLHELNLDWLIENISQLVKDGTVISVNGMSGRVTLYTEKDIELPPRAFDANWSVYRRIADKMAGLQFTGEKFFYITKNMGDEDFTIQEVFTSNNPPPYPVTSVNGRIGTVIIAGDNTPYNMDGVDTIESVVSNIQKAIGPVVQYNTCAVGVTAGQYVYLFLSGITGRADGVYKAANNKSANTTWTSADLIPVATGIGGVLADNENSINTLNTNIANLNNSSHLSGTSTYLASYDIYYTKLGKVCTFVCQFVTNTDISSSIGTIDNIGLPKPKHDFVCVYPVVEEKEAWNASDVQGRFASFRGSTALTSAQMKASGPYTEGITYSFAGSYVTEY